MQITVRKNLAAPLITLLELHRATYAGGVCGVLTEGSRNIVEGTTLSSSALLSYLIEMDYKETDGERLRLIDVTIPEGKLTYQSLGEATGGILTPPSNATREVAMITSPVTIKVILGASSYDQPLTEEQVLAFVGKENGLALTLAKLPLLPQPIKFDLKIEGDIATITSEDLLYNPLEWLLQDLSKTL